ncbi:CrfX protein [Pseudomonas sp. 5P_3.1_Bac2]|uniref:CrfX protein n=1 Tax=Pseudomonas sp. 5P_3.1_Bac2 TaxID=2971617 RepID=UPI0021CA3E5D|nr:CrfX protein [Pseudomonas sp. 5P_3.1_Bac2]MCU1716313.1 CrfX protein [Pseudomonas sp. 5P_3.1_Bac2]
MNDPFEQSLRELLNSPSADYDDDAGLHRVLKTANRQVGAGDLFALMGNWVGALMLALNNGSRHVAPVSRRSTPPRSTDKAE